MLKYSPRTRSKTFLNFFALELSVFKTKQLRNILGRVLGPDFNVQNPFFNPIPKLF